MIKFFHSPDSVVLNKTVLFPEIHLKGSEAARNNGIIPFSHIYLTSASQLNHFVKHLSRPGQDQSARSLQILPEATADKMLQHGRCPMNLSFRTEGIAAAIETLETGSKNVIKFAIVNGMGRGYGDNVSGLGSIQHLFTFLSARYETVEIDILQRNSGIQSVIYTRYEVINRARQLPLTVTQFYQYDAYVDFTDMLAIPQVVELPLYEFFLHGLSLQKEVLRKSEKRTRLLVDQTKTDRLRLDVCSQSADDKNLEKQKIVLIHPTASTPLRSIPEDILHPLIEALLINTSYIFVHCVPIEIGHDRLVDMSDKASDINAFFDVIASCDAVITVGTVVYHISGNLDLPTLLIPTVQADVDSAQFFPSVQSVLTDTTLTHVSEKHMSKQEQDIAQIRPIWESLKASNIAQFLREVI